MKSVIDMKALAILILTGIGAGLINVALYILVTGPLAAGSKPDEVGISTYVLNVFVGWVFFSAWFLSKADEEMKRSAEAVARSDREAFMVEAPKRISPTIQILYLVISALVVLGLHMFHFESPLALLEIQFGTGFLVGTTILILWDLDDPIGGVISIPNIPAEWIKELKEK